MGDTPKVRMDRGKDYATVHGEREHGSTHALVHFYQDGLPFDSNGFLLFDHAVFELGSENPSAQALKLRALAERKLKKASKNRPAEPAPDDADAPSDDDDRDQDEGDDGDDDDSVNLEAWLRGEQDVQWHILTQEIARRYKRRVANLPDAVVFLVEQNVVPPDQVAKKYQKHLD